jgi:hypothetical protein
MFIYISAKEAKLHILLFNYGKVCEYVNKLAKAYQAFLAKDACGT